MKKTHLVFLLVLVSTLLVDQLLGAKVYIDIRSPSFRKFPIALAPFKGSGPSGQDMKLEDRAREILREDLDLSGFFSLIVPSSAPEKTAARRGAAPRRTRWISNRGQTSGRRPWSEATISHQNGSLTVEARLYDVVKKELIVGKRYIGDVTDLSRMMHRFADEIIFAITGEQGFFQTRIVFVSTARGNKELFLMDYDGRNVSQLTYHKSIILSPRVSPDGTRVVFTSYKMGNPDLFMKDLRSGEERRISNYPGLNMSPAWSPDGKTAGPDPEQGWKPGDLHHECRRFRPGPADEQPGYRCFPHLVPGWAEDRLRLQPGGHSPDIRHGRQRAECSTVDLRRKLQHPPRLVPPGRPDRLRRLARRGTEHLHDPPRRVRTCES